MKYARALLLALLLITGTGAAPVPRDPCHVPSPQRVLDRLKAEGFDVSGLKHVGGDRWTLEHLQFGLLPCARASCSAS
jgi:hypothetical protein